MNLKKILNTDLINLDIKANTKEEILAEMFDMLIAAGKIPSKERQNALDAVLKREGQMSTGIQCGVAIPHGKCDGIKDLVACVAISKEGKDFAALDNQPSKIFVMTISPSAKTGPHVQFLADLSRLLTQPDKREAILAATTAKEVLTIFVE